MGKIHCFTTKAEKSFYDQSVQPGDGLLFGPETRGLPEDVREERGAQCVQIPMEGPTRSLNLANTVAIATFEGLRQLRAAKNL